MRISVVVKPNSRTESVELLANGTYQVRVKASPVEGCANEAVREALAGYFTVPKSAIAILKGITGRRKRVEVRSSLTISKGRPGS